MDSEEKDRLTGVYSTSTDHSAQGSIDFGPFSKHQNQGLWNNTMLNPYDQTYNITTVKIQDSTGGQSYSYPNINDLTLGTTYQTPNTISTTGIHLTGEADIDFNGKSLRDWMEQVEQRLNILTPNHELEKEWNELRELGQRYRELERQCQEKAKMWNKLKSMPPVAAK